MPVKCYGNMSESHSQIREENNISLDSDDFHSGCRKSQSVTPTNMLFKQIVTRKIKMTRMVVTPGFDSFIAPQVIWLSSNTS